MQQHKSWYAVIERLKLNDLCESELNHFYHMSADWNVCACGEICSDKRFVLVEGERQYPIDEKLHNAGSEFYLVWDNLLNGRVDQPEAATALSYLMTRIALREITLSKQEDKE